MPSSKLRRSRASTLRRIGSRRASSNWGVVVILESAPKDIGGPEYKEYHAHIAVHGEKRGVYAGKIVCVDQPVFPEKQRGDGRNTGKGERPETKGLHEKDQAENHRHVEASRDP